MSFVQYRSVLGSSLEGFWGRGSPRSAASFVILVAHRSVGASVLFSVRRPASMGIPGGPTGNKVE